jgi:hypothetical protein
MPEHTAVVGVYNSHTEEEAAVKELQKSALQEQAPSCRARHDAHNAWSPKLRFACNQ